MDMKGNVCKCATCVRVCDEIHEPVGCVGQRLVDGDGKAGKHQGNEAERLRGGGENDGAGRRKERKAG